ncbi:MAG TPA: ABC transporter ATP-binding protein [Terriglobales bacterium]|nr:ABC transporter ATP-binding protein [Terriglobales bacterium]
MSETFCAARMYALLGENGAGKTTLLRCIAGLARPSRGSVTLFGETNLRSVLHRLGYMAHPSLLYDEMSGMENLRYFAGLYGIDDPQRCREVIQLVGLDPDLARRVGQYSQGMRQRLSLARAIVHDPELLLLDEPFSNVDITSARDMVRLLGTMRDAGKTIVIVTHQASLLEGVADEVVSMHAGRVVGRSRHLPASSDITGVAAR